MVADSILLALKKAGHKLTGPRVEILNILSSTDPLSAQEVFEMSRRKRLAIDLVTIYRTLELFEDLGFVRKTTFGDKISRFEIVDDEEHHHHLICVSCGEVQDIEVDEGIIIKKIESRTEFKVQKHSLEFFGLCRKCQ